ncbi:HIT family protein [Bdellovibrio svalbardensis]|uniref:HIT domain-containing protein n=1 Tax=Bdellovibrio svalbardensis TaxID=2972972 RepID=A0ABT6DPS6_9BACT|nr:HIT domain-containing protein [Bdellovibrio svalbardensis]MDG0817924.1 HIT domain-containing protein [Bdellovibrio svalbardensis]
MALKKQTKKTKSVKKSKTVTKKTVAPKRAEFRVDSEIWPLERDVLIRPDRMKYVRKLIKPEGCVFCNASKGGIAFETLCVYKTKYSMVVLNKFPYNSGHVLVLPVRHCGDVLQLHDEEYADIQNTVRLVMKALMEIYEPGGINVGLNHGAVAGAGIPDHLHYHVIPRWAGDLNFFPLIAETKVLVESLEQTYDKLLGYFRKI